MPVHCRRHVRFWRKVNYYYEIDALGDVDELPLAGSVTRFSQPNWEREHQAEPTCFSTKRYITVDRLPVLPPDVLSWYSSHNRPSHSEIQKLASNNHLHTAGDDIVLLASNPTLPLLLDAPRLVARAPCLLKDDSVRVYVPLPMRI